MIFTCLKETKYRIRFTRLFESEPPFLNVCFVSDLVLCDSLNRRVSEEHSLNNILGCPSCWSCLAVTISPTKFHRSPTRVVPVSVKKSLLQIGRDNGILASQTPNRGVNNSFCYWISCPRLSEKGVFVSDAGMILHARVILSFQQPTFQQTKHP